MSILGTCRECLHNKDGMCNLRPRICVNYDHFVLDKMIVISKNDLEQKYVSRFELDAANARAAELQAALDAAINMNIDANAKVVRLTAALEEANSALISMVYQYCYRPLDANKEPAIDIYQHDFMSAGEEAFAYLVEHGLAKWTDESRYAILINSKTSLYVKSDD